MPDANETSCFPHDLAPGDDLLGTGIGGYEGHIESVRVGVGGETTVHFSDGRRVDFPFSFEVCTVRRASGRVHPVIAGVLAAHGIGR